jgi:hypothetical protein
MNERKRWSDACLPCILPLYEAVGLQGKGFDFGSIGEDFVFTLWYRALYESIDSKSRRPSGPSGLWYEANPKSEARSSKQIRNPKHERSKQAFQGFGFLSPTSDFRPPTSDFHPLCLPSSVSVLCPLISTLHLLPSVFSEPPGFSHCPPLRSKPQHAE